MHLEFGDIYSFVSFVASPNFSIFPADPGDIELPTTEHRPTVGRHCFLIIRRRCGEDLHVRPRNGRSDHRPHVRRLDNRQRPHRRPGALLLEQRLQVRSKKGEQSEKEQVEITEIKKFPVRWEKK